MGTVRGHVPGRVLVQTQPLDPNEDPGRPRRVLFVDDHEEILESLRQLLQADYEVHTAVGGQEALELCRSAGPFAVVVSDHDMPGMTGTELLEAVGREWPQCARMLLTARLDVDLAVEALHRAGVCRLLQKPFTRAQLCEALELGVERHALQAAERALCQRLQFTRESLIDFTVLLEGRVEEHAEALRVLHELALDLTRAPSLEAIAARAAGALSHLLGGRGVRLVLFGADAASAELLSEAGPPLMGDLHRHPVCTAEGQVGRIEVACPGPELSRHEQQLVASVASSSAVAVHNEMRRRERDEAQHATVFALARLAENRDDETGRHLDRVSAYCRLIALGLREDGHYVAEIDDRFVEDLVRSAPLHDIGKVGIPDSILLKPAPLTEDEWSIMREHTTIGAETLRAIIEENDQQASFLHMGLQIAWCHHEKWNGGGYPRGLSGERIPLCARILSLADCYDALTTRRPYKEPWTHDQALAFVTERAGRDFDPAAVRVVLARESAFDGIRSELADGESAPAGRRAIA